MKLIKTKYRFILISDEDIKYDDYFFDNNNGLTGQYFQGHMDFTFCNKIIAGIPELPLIDFSLLKEADCKRIGWVDVEKLALNDNAFYAYGGDYDTFEVGYKAGFKTAQSLNDKMVSLETILSDFYVYATDGEVCKHEVIKDYIQSLQQTSWDVEVEMDTDIVKVNENTSYQPCPIFDKLLPKITNNLIKVTKIL